MDNEKIDKKYWCCIVGPTDQGKLKSGSDSPMRNAVAKEFYETTGHDSESLWSGWGNTQEKVDILNAVWSMDEDDPILIGLVAMLKATKRL